MKKTYITKGVCSTQIDIEVADGRIKTVAFQNGCQGNLKGIGALVTGMKPEEAIAKLQGITCGNKNTSCPDQLARALSELIALRA